MWQMTPEQRKASIRDRALKLQAEKEAAKAAEDAAHAAQQFEENCDLLRQRISQQRTQQATAARQGQVTNHTWLMHRLKRASYLHA